MAGTLIRTFNTAPWNDSLNFHSKEMDDSQTMAPMDYGLEAPIINPYMYMYMYTKKLYHVVYQIPNVSDIDSIHKHGHTLLSVTAIFTHFTLPTSINFCNCSVIGNLWIMQGMYLMQATDSLEAIGRNIVEKLDQSDYRINLV